MNWWLFFLQVRASFLELYNEDVYDLLNKERFDRTHLLPDFCFNLPIVAYRVKLNLKEDPDKGVYVQGLQSFVMKDVAETNELMQEGKKSRQVGATLMNPVS